MVGDSVPNDVEGAVAHGFHSVVWVEVTASRRPAPTPVLPAGVHRVQRLAEVPPLLGIA
jgi:FMN phosphatase YigB (HAD superfamily)